MMLDVTYQGNAWWALLEIASLVVLFYFLFRVRKKRKAGVSIDIRTVIGISLWLLGFFAIALFQVFSHQ